MSESQSRYSIISRLTDMKLQLIRERSEMEQTIKRKSEDLAEVRAQIKEYESDVETRISQLRKQLEGERRELLRNERRASASYESVIAGKKSKEEAIQQQIDAIEDAMGRIEAVSSTASQQSQS